MKLSVVIPTHNRADALKTCLKRLAAQEKSENLFDYEVIVVDDGSTDETESVVSSAIASLEMDLKYIKQEKSHQGVARNRGVEKATGEIIVFIGDDIFVESDFLKWHFERHAEHPGESVSVLGFTTWDPSLEINDYMKFLESSGWQFGYQFLTAKMIGRADLYKFFYTSNISLKKSFFDKERFDEAFTCYGWEDIELGYRLWKNHGLEIYYEPQAKAFHHHVILPSDLSKKMQAVGKSALHFEKLQPEVQIIPKGLKGRLLRIASSPVFRPFSRLLGKLFYYRVRSWGEFFKGVGDSGY